jgi:hypothetical protein
MNNYYHILLHTPRAKLSRAMQGSTARGSNQFTNRRDLWADWFRVQSTGARVKIKSCKL